MALIIPKRELIRLNRRAFALGSAASIVGGWTHGGGNSCPFGSGLGDGCPAAPPGTPQFPNMLKTNNSGLQTYGLTLLARPAWNVAGVDYHVGIDRTLYPTNAALADPLNATQDNLVPALLALGGVFDLLNPTFKRASFNTNGVTIQGYNFALHNGVRVDLNGNSITFKNNYVENEFDPVASNYAVGFGPSSCVITQCEIDGAGRVGGTGFGLITGAVSGTGNKITYSIISNAWAENFYLSTADSNSVLDIKYNIITNGGMGRGPSGGSVHGDWIQFSNNVSDTWGAINCDYNLWLQDATTTFLGGPAATQGITFAPLPSVLATYQEYLNNTILVKPTAQMSPVFMGYCLDCQLLTNMNNNYITKNTGYDDSGNPSNAPSLDSAFVSSGPFLGVINRSGNIDMMTGGSTT